jgi:FeS assembly SUF system protein
MGFGKMLSGLFKKDDEQAIVSDTNETKEEGSVESITDIKESPSPDISASQTALSDHANESNAPASEAGAGDKPAATQSPDGNSEVTQDKVLETLSQVYDPEIPIDIVNLGLIYGVDIEDGRVMIRMTMTAPGCPASTQIAGESKILVEELPGVESCDIELVWDPPWDPSKMSEEAQQSLVIF